MEFRRMNGNVQLPRNGFIGRPVGNVPKDLAFASGERNPGIVRSKRAIEPGGAVGKAG